MGLPWVVTDVGDVIEQVGGVVDVVPPEDVDALVAALRRAVTDPAHRRSRAAAGRRCAEEHHDAARMVATTYELVRGAVG